MRKILCLIFSLIFLIGFLSAGIQQDTYDDALAIYHLNGNANESKFGSNNGTVTEAINDSGKFGDAYWFDGIDDKITLDAIATAQADDPVSWNLWGKLDQLGAAQLMALGRGYGNDHLGYHNNGKIDATLKIDGQYPYCSSNSAHDVGIWKMMTLVYNGTDMLLYVNGTLQNDIESISGDIARPTSDWQIGSNGHNGNWWNGTVDEVTFYDAALTQDQIDWLWNDGAGNELTDPEVSVTLNSPADNYHPTVTEVTFNCSAQTEYDEYIQNMSVWTNYTGVWAMLNITEYPTDECYQESTDVSTACGGLATGNYSFTYGTYFTDPDNTYDGDWNTYSNVSIEDALVSTYMKPTSFYTAATWQVKDSSGTQNLTIPQACWDMFEDYITVGADLHVDGSMTYWCGAIGDEHSLDFSGGVSAFYEEAIIWGGKANNITDTFSYNFPTEPTFDWNCRACDTTGSCSYAAANRTVNLMPYEIEVAGSCPAGYDAALTYNFADETNFTSMNASVDYIFRYGITNSSSQIVNGTLSNVAEFSVCINSTYSTSYTLGYGEIQYEKSGWADRRYYPFEGTEITNDTVTRTLYLLSGATSFLFQVKNSDLSVLDGKILTLNKWYPEIDEYKIVEVSKTDDKGETVMKVEVEDVDYRVGVYYPNGSIIYLASPIRFVCIESPCTYALTLEETAGTSFETWLNLDYSLTYNEATGIFTFTYNDPSQETQNITLDVYRETGRSSVLICSDSATGYIGVATCNVSGYTGMLRAIAYRTASPAAAVATLFYEALADGLSSTMGLFLTLITMITLVMIGVVSPVLTVLLSVLGFVPALMFGIMPLSILLIIMAMGFIVIHFMKRSVTS